MIKSLIAAFLVITLAAHSKNYSPSVPRSYIDTPKYNYFYVIRISPYEWKGNTDTLSMVINEIGKVKSVDDAEAYKNIAYRQLQKFIQKITLDSVKIKKQ